MNRSPLFYPLNRGMDADAGGAADLQTDVMRFMAIISMCLVAIFALVQSIPLAPVPQVETVDLPDPEPTPVVPAEKPDEPITLVRPEIAKTPPPEAPVRLDRPVAMPMTKTVEAPPVIATDVIADTTAESPAAPVSLRDANSAPADTQKGFTLRFESDAALTWLVERDVVGLYAITDSSIQRMSIQADRISFWPASAPQRFHEMEVTTVPAIVLREWRTNASASETRWGVSIPAPMARELEDYLARDDGGAIIIGRDGKLRLEQ